MEKLPERIHDEGNGINYMIVGDYYIPLRESGIEMRILRKNNPSSLYP